VHPFQFVLLTLLVMTACVFHEFGHASAARYDGARPGTIGVGLCLSFPVFYTDVSDSYRLDRRGRLRTDLGVYFNAIAVVAAGMAYFATGFKPLLVFVVVFQLRSQPGFGVVRYPYPRLPARRGDPRARLDCVQCTGRSGPGIPGPGQPSRPGPAKLRCRFPSARFPGAINSRELAVADF
jgi:hypothetical protein